MSGYDDLTPIQRIAADDQVDALIADINHTAHELGAPDAFFKVVDGDQVFYVMHPELLRLCQTEPELRKMLGLDRLGGEDS